jgi:hypothetical protein
LVPAASALLAVALSAAAADGELLETAMVLPGATPTATPTAPPPPNAPTPRPLEFRPPLNIDECLALIERAAAQLPPAGATDPALPVESIVAMINSAFQYLNLRDDLHTSLAHYRWIRLASGRVDNEPGRIDRDVYTFEVPVRRISAICLEVETGDVLLHGIDVYDENNQRRQQFEFAEPKRLRHLLPRRDVFHLWRRTTISRIEIRYSRHETAVSGPAPRVHVLGGVTSQQEFIKTALYSLQVEAIPAIREGRYGAAREALATAAERIRDFQRQKQRAR